MAQDTESRRLRAKQVGMLMQAYRRAYPVEGRSGRLSQDGLLQLMARVDSKYSERYDHSTVARWESGATRPTKDRLEVFGRALNLTNVEIEGLVRLAGLNEDQNASYPGPVPGSTEIVGSQLGGEARENEPVPAAAHSYIGAAARYFLSRFFGPGLVVAGSGFVLAYFGWNAAWMMMLYLIVAIGLVLIQGYLRLRRSNDLRELLFISVFFLLGANLLQVPIVRMDPYGYYAIGGWAGTPLPYLLALLTCLLMALAAGLIFDFLWRWQYSGTGGSGNICRRAVWTAFPPLGFVYVWNLVLGGLGTWIYLLAVFAILGGTFMVLLIMRDEKASFNQWERRLLLQAGVAVSIVLTAVGGAAVFIIYLQPSMLVIPDHSLLRSWEIDFAALGYSPVELMERYRIGAVWSTLAAINFMVLVLGGNLLVGIYRLDTDDSSPPEDPGTEASAVAAAEASPQQKRIKRKRRNIQSWAGWLGRHIITPAASRVRCLFR